MVWTQWAVLVLAAARAASALTSTSTRLSVSTTSNVPPATHTVIVGVGGHSYSPNSTRANVGDTILFEFTSGNHSVARAEYGFPCIPYEDTGIGKTGFWSGFRPFNSQQPDNIPMYQLLVNSTEPTFFYCAADGSCVPNGMIGVINPNSSQTLQYQLSLITATTVQYSPDQSPPSESTAKPTATPSPSDDGGSSSLSGGAIAGIVIGSVAFVALAAATFYLCGRNRSLSDVLRYSQPPQPRPNTIPPVPFTGPLTEGPYSPSFSPKIGHSPSPGLNTHDSWHTQRQHRMSPEMTEGRSLVTSIPYNQGYLDRSDGVGNPTNVQNYRQPGPGEAPWSPGGFATRTQYASVPQKHELDTDSNIASPGLSSPGARTDSNSFMTYPQQPPEPVDRGPHELDARPNATPPDYEK